MLTEFGGIAYDKSRPAGVETAWGYCVAHSDEEFAQRYCELMEVVAHVPLFSGFCYTQFVDVFQEASGLLCADRTPKIPLEQIRKATKISRTYIPGAS